MEPIKSTFTRKGYIHNLLKRWDCPITDRGFAIFDQKDGDRLVAYEVIEIVKIRKAATFPGGKVFPPREIVPGDGAWGTKGWTVGTLERADEVFNELINKLKVEAHEKN